MSTPSIPVLLVDDHPVVRRGLAQALATTDDIAVVGQASGGREAIEMMRHLHPAVVVLDYSMGDMDGTQVMTKLADQHRGVGVVVFTVHESVHYAIHALKAGARGYVVKGGELDEVIEAIRIVSRGDRYVTPRLHGELAGHLGRRTDGRSGFDLLSPREFELVRCRVRGMTIKETGEHMHVSESTASTYQQRTMEKLGLKNTAQLIRHAVDHGVVG